MKPAGGLTSDLQFFFVAGTRGFIGLSRALERMRQTPHTAKLEAKQQQAKEQVQAMDLNQVVAASVTQSLLQVLPTCGVRVPKRQQETVAAAATKSLNRSQPRR